MTDLNPLTPGGSGSREAPAGGAGAEPEERRRSAGGGTAEAGGRYEEGTPNMGKSCRGRRSGPPQKGGKNGRRLTFSANPLR
jgi:hypothetical protein